MPSRLASILMSVLLVALPACRQAGDQPATSASPTTSGRTPVDASPTADAGAGSVATLITGQSIGPVELGVEGDRLADTLGPGYTVTGPHTDIFVDQVLYEVSRDGEVHLYAGWLNGEPTTISLIVTDNSLYRTAEGIGPGSTIEQAAEAYGSPTLNYSLSNEGREYADFPAAPAERMSFRVGNAGDLAGIYTTQEEFNETTEWRPEATIQYVLITRPPA